MKKNILFKAGSLLSVMALTLALITNGTTCWFLSYQPEEPKELSKFKKK